MLKYKLFLQWRDKMTAEKVLADFISLETVTSTF